MMISPTLLNKIFSPYSAKVAKSIKNTRVLGVRLSVPRGAAAVVTGAAEVRIIVAAPARLAVAGREATYGTNGEKGGLGGKRSGAVGASGGMAG